LKKRTLREEGEWQDLQEKQTLITRNFVGLEKMCEQIQNTKSETVMPV
jgi:hypothetical protein